MDYSFLHDTCARHLPNKFPVAVGCKYDKERKIYSAVEEEELDGVGAVNTCGWQNANAIWQHGPCTLDFVDRRDTQLRVLRSSYITIQTGPLEL